jgi:hypothetical protein
LRIPRDDPQNSSDVRLKYADSEMAGSSRLLRDIAIEVNDPENQLRTRRARLSVISYYSFTIL